MKDAEEAAPGEVAFISDIHSNLEALDVVLTETAGITTYCLGDVVGYGASPNEVVELLRKKNVRSVLGNHDYAAVTGDFGDFNARAAMAVAWTSQHLTKENSDYLAALPRERRIRLGTKEIYLTHGSPDDNLWEYVDLGTHSDLFDHYLDRLSVQGMALGHTHLPYLWREKGRVVFNPGSVGQPRSGDSRASYGLLREKDGELVVELKKKKYDIELSARKIIRAGLPESLGERLFQGR